MKIKSSTENSHKAVESTGEEYNLGGLYWLTIFKSSECIFCIGNRIDAIAHDKQDNYHREKYPKSVDFYKHTHVPFDRKQPQ